MKSKRAKATDISKSVKEKVWERDGGRCVICGERYTAMPNMHYISRARGGIGIEENVVTGCMQCHNEYDNGGKLIENGNAIRAYLDRHYPDFPDEARVYHKYDTGLVVYG